MLELIKHSRSKVRIVEKITCKKSYFTSVLWFLYYASSEDIGN